MTSTSKNWIAPLAALFVLLFSTLAILMVIPSSSVGSGTITEPEIDLGSIGRGNKFIENLGQWDSRIHFRGDTEFGHVALGSSSLIFNIIDMERLDFARGDVLWYELIGSNEVEPIGDDPLPGTSNYFLGNDPSAWVSGARSFKSAHYGRVWKGIDLDYFLGDIGPKYEFTIRPFADPSRIKIGLQGHRTARVIEQDLVMELESGRVVRDSGLKAFYSDDREREIEVSFVMLDGSTFSFDIGEYDESKEIIIDPTLIYSSFMGGTGMESWGRSTMDDQGSIYVTGTSWSYDFPFSPGAYSTNSTKWGNVVVFKMNQTLSNLTYATFIGGDAGDEGLSIAMASNGEVIVTGLTQSFDFPTTKGAYQRSKHPEKYQYVYWDLFVLRLNNNGSGLIYSTYIGKEGSESIPTIAVDSSGNAVVSAMVKTANFTTTDDAYFKNYTGGESDIVLFVLNRTGEKLLYSTFMGGSGFDEPGDIKLIDDHLVYMTGRTNSTDLPTTLGAYDRSFNPNKTNENPFVMCFNLTSNSFEFSTYMSIGAGKAIALDDERNVYVGGST